MEVVWCGMDIKAAGALPAGIVTLLLAHVAIHRSCPSHHRNQINDY